MAGTEGAVPFHVMGDFSQALAITNEALAAVRPDNPMRQGLVAEAALRHERLGDHQVAVDLAYTAIAPFRGAESVESGMIRAERQPSAHLNAGTVLLRTAARQRLAGDGVTANDQSSAVILLQGAWGGIKYQRSGWKPHQHAINASGRMSMVEAVEGQHLRAFGYGIGAVVLGAMSESPRLVEHTSGLAFRERMAAKARGMARGAGALAVAALSLPKSRSANRLRDRVILSRAFGA